MLYGLLFERGVAFYFFRGQTHFLGDGYQLLDWLKSGTHLKPWEKGTFLVQSRVFDLMGGGSSDALPALQLISYLAGLLLILGAAIAAALIAAAAGGGVKLVEDKPTVKPPRSGDVTGRVTPAASVSGISAISRVTEKRITPTSFDRQTGKFVFKSLPGEASYDVCVKTTDGRELEGIDLDFLDARMLRLAAERRKRLELPPEAPHEFSVEDVNLIVKQLTSLREFMEIHRPLYVEGHGKWATVLIEMMRTRKHYAGGDRLIWRVELWYMEYRHGGWEKIGNQERVLRRLRVTPAVWQKTHVEYYHTLSAFVDELGHSSSIQFKIPDRPDITRGRPANTKPVQPVKPYVLGLDVKPNADTDTKNVILLPDSLKKSAGAAGSTDLRK